MNYKEIKKNAVVQEFMKKGNANLGVLGYTEHSQVHASVVAMQAANILKKSGYTEHEIELAKIAGFMHDIGNAINRHAHAEYGALLANQILQKTDMALEDIVTVVAAIGNHDEHTGTAVDAVSAAVIIADKTDVRRNRVRNEERSTFDIHDRVNYAVTESKLCINIEKRVIIFDIILDEEICSMMEYFEIFLERMLMCRRAAERLNLKFKMTANGSKVL